VNHKVYAKGNILIIEIAEAESGFAQEILDKVRDLLHSLHRPFCLILDYHQLDLNQQVIPPSETAALVQIIELLDRTGRTHAVWIHQTPSRNAEIFAHLISRHSIAYTKAHHAHSLEEAEKTAKRIMK